MNVLKKSELGKFIKSGGLRATLVSNVMNAKGYAPRASWNYTGNAVPFCAFQRPEPTGFGTQRLGGLPQFVKVYTE
jgi:hypothetical protein